MQPPGNMVLDKNSPSAKALAFTPAQIKPPKESPTLRRYLAGIKPAKNITSKQLFYQSGKPLPCLLKQDLSKSDPWLTAADYYPAYHALFKHFTAKLPRVRMLEIGVRTGYVAAVLAHAVTCPALYVGVDPNRYIANGLELAGATVQALRKKHPAYDGVLIEGYSWEDRIHETLRDSGPFDLIHIDGHHVLDAKLHDIELAKNLLAPKGLVLVDDLDHMECVKSAVERMMTLHLFAHYARYPTYRGLAVLRN